ncbi:response regulator transcription factor [Paenibacillus koleovorans]|uniref:response regulator transcription factor n=1 Tax=Paenibacillus koleovorans TaxID=121608 RepID=UPI000FD9B5FE|nr:response regulator [Paenibacillus koleovorans]
MSSYSILIVDDEPMIRRGLQKLVETSGRPIGTIRLASSAEEALVQLEAQLPDFVLTDIRLPEMDGIELCRLIQLRGWPVQVAVISGYGEFQYAQKCLSYGVKEYLLKPIKTEELERVLDKLIDEAEGGSQRTLSIGDCEAYMTRIGDSIWYLQEQELHAALEDWRLYVQSIGLQPRVLARLLLDNLSNLIRSLNTRDVYPFDAVRTAEWTADGQTAATLFALFKQAALGMYDYLHLKRRGFAIDPIEAAKEYIDTHLNKEVSLDEVAQHLGLNSSYFSQLFKQTTQETFVHYRMKKRMERAKWLLERESYRMSDIALEIGYIDYSHFAKTFKKWFGVSPTEYRAKLGLD